jgi:DNA-binding transcriptional ArsR family regulator
MQVMVTWICVNDMGAHDKLDPLCTADEHDPSGVRRPLVDDLAVERASRLRLLSRLAQGEMCVTELAASEQESLSTISQRLRVLRSENIIVRRRRGKHINYTLADQHVMDLVFNALAHATERPASGPSRPTDFEKENQS